jgi:hypothetical protein
VFIVIWFFNSTELFGRLIILNYPRKCSYMSNVACIRIRPNMELHRNTVGSIGDAIRKTRESATHCLAEGLKEHYQDHNA